jgi:hypothetical protein
MESTTNGVHSGAQVLLDWGQLGDSEERGKWMARELVSWIAKSCVSPVVRGVRQERLLVDGGRVRGRGHIDRA